MKKTVFGIVIQIASLSQLQSQCINPDFEQSQAAVITSSTQINGWSVTSGYNYTLASSSSLSAYYPNGISSNPPPNSCNVIACCPMPPVDCELITPPPGGYFDPLIGNSYPIYSVFGAGASNTAAAVLNPQVPNGMFGNNLIRLNQLQTSVPFNYNISMLSKTFSVTPQNALFRFAYIAVVEGAHGCCDAGSFIARMVSPVACPMFSITAPDNSCLPAIAQPPFYFTGSGNTYTYNANSQPAYIFNKWQVMSYDLSAYIGQQVTIELIAMRCTAGGHPAIVYIDAECGPSGLLVNGVLASTSQIVSCSASPQASIAAPPGFTSYLWSGPGGYTNSAQSIVTSTPGIYSLTLGQVTSCQLPPRTFTLSFNSTTVSATGPSSVCAGYPATLTSSGFSTQTWTGGNTGPATVVNPSISTIYTVSGINLSGCAASATVAIMVPPTNLTITGQSAMICTGDSILIGAYGLTGHTWSNGAPTATQYVRPQADAVYTLSGTTSAGCFTAIPLPVYVSTLQSLYASVSPSIICTGMTATLLATGLTTYSWSNGHQSNTFTVTATAGAVLAVSGENQDHCKETGTVNLVIADCTGIDEETGSDLAIIPNPAQESCEIHTTGITSATLQVRNFLGQLVLTGEVADGSLRLDLRAFAPGVYHCTLRAINRKTLSARLIIE